MRDLKNFFKKSVAKRERIMVKRSFLGVAFLLCISSSVQAVLLVGFSYNRPLQLYAFLESVEEFVTGLAEVKIIYRADNDAYDAGYSELKKRFPSVLFIRQSIKNPRSDFKPLVMNALSQTQQKEVLFAVDDIYVVAPVDLAVCTQALAETGAYGFYLRLGKNTTYCYAMDKQQGVPPLKNLKNNICAWEFSAGTYDWAYPHTVDMTVYRIKEVLKKIEPLTFSTPNLFEGQWASIAPVRHTGLCFSQSKIVNVPLNSVQQDWTNKNMNYADAAWLLELFNKNNKIDRAALKGLSWQSAHAEWQPVFCKRTC
jgi:hypothetical protein